MSQRTEGEDMRLIDADALKDLLKEYCVDGDSIVQTWYCTMGIDDCIDNAPTVDAIPIVRCADCKYSGAWFGHTMKCKKFHQLFDESFYCTFGEWVEE